MSYQDGSNNASAGAPQLPNLLSGYAVRAPWNVAGVDYAVGVPTGTALKDWETIRSPVYQLIFRHIPCGSPATTSR